MTPKPFKLSEEIANALSLLGIFVFAWIAAIVFSL